MEKNFTINKININNMGIKNQRETKYDSKQEVFCRELFLICVGVLLTS